jgi:hypothetical protein
MGEEMFKRNIALALLAPMCIPLAAKATVLFSDDFSVDDGASWNKNVAPAANAAQQAADFAFDYSSYGIPAAPGSVDTKGLRLRANVPGSASSPVVGTRPAGVLSGISVSPTGFALPGTTYKVSFYAWSNFHGSQANGLADNAGSPGGTNNITFALGTSGTNPEVVGTTNASNVTTSVSGVTLDGVVFATTGDGGIPQDYRAFVNSNTPALPTSGVYTTNASDAQSNTNAYYSAIFGTHTAPSAQAAIATGEVAGDTNIMNGPSQTGSFGFAWHRVDLIRNGNVVVWDVDGFRIATTDVSAVALGTNFALGASDVNGSTTSHPALLFSLIDNVQVSDVIPEPASLGLLAFGAGGLVRRRRSR